MEKFRAFRVHQEETEFRSGVEHITFDDLPEGDVTIRVHYSSVNYKDGLASIPEGKIVKRYPFIPGIDLAGEVADSKDGRYRTGDLVLCTGYGLGVSHEGGFAEFARVPGDWLVPLPAGLTPLEAMGIGTAGFTAALSVERLLANGVTPDGGPVLVAGATGGVGSMAVSILGRLGFEVAAVTGKAGTGGIPERLLALGASRVLSREEAASGAKGALGKELWAAAVDPVGGVITGDLLKIVKYGGSVAVSGMAAGGSFDATVYPFILRGVNLLGIDSVFCPMPLRLKIWERLAGEWKPETALSEWLSVFGLEHLPEALATILQGKAKGRQVVSLSE